MTSRFYGVLDRVIATAGAPELQEVVGAARRQFDERRGRVFPDEPLWESWTQSFLEWFALEHVPAGFDVCLATRALAELADPADAETLRAWLRSVRTLAEITNVKPGRVEVLDLLGGARYAVQEQRTLAGVRAGDVAEVRLVGTADQVRFGRTMTFHPTGTRGAIAKRIEELKGKGAPAGEILDHVARLRVRCERYAHIKPAKIYESADDRVPTGGLRL